MFPSHDLAQAQQEQYVNNVADAELSVIKNEIGGNLNPAIEAAIVHLNQTNPKYVNFIRDPNNLNEAKIRQGVRELYADAQEMVKQAAIASGGIPDPQAVQNLANAQKQAAATSTPVGRANTSTAEQENPEIQLLRERGWSALFPE